MLITTSRRPCHRARLLGRELARVLPRARYLPRGTKTIRKLAHLASSLGYRTITLVTSKGDQPAELRFLEVGEGWRWVDLSLVLHEVKLQRDLGRRVRLEEAKIGAEGAEARELAGRLSRLWGIPWAEGPAEELLLVKELGGLVLEFHAREELVGPVLRFSRGRVLGW